MISRFAMPGLLCAAIALPILPAPGAQADRNIPLFSKSVPLSPQDRDRDRDRDSDCVRAGALLYRGGLAIRSTYRRFGGLSGLVVSPDGKRLTAISDRGSWFSAGILYDETGRLAGLADGRTGALLSPEGARLRGRAADAEALTVLSDGSALVAFERRHRIYRYPAGPHPLAGRPTLWPAPAGLAAAPFNGGAETLAHIGRGDVLLLAEDLRIGDNAFAGWIGRNGRWQHFAYARTGDFRPTDATMLPNGDIAVLERHFTLATGHSARIVLLPRAAVAPGTTVRGKEILHLTPSMTVDNFEGISARRGRNGRTVLYILSDDNFNPLQRTLLLMFEMR